MPRLSSLAGCEVVHFATHGVYGADTGVTPGALCLSPSGDDDGYLRADDITGLDLTSCQVVLLSACRTGWGRSSYEGSLGSARAFLYAGARAVVVSLWPVDAAATADLMVALHGILRSGVPVGEALRRAMRWSRDDGSPLRHWASFAVVGAGWAAPVTAVDRRGRGRTGSADRR
ncbi:CHAT domain-containing protein [Micromonospora sp. LOL_021]|uniref:CHAT domain-containing protein n=1 Tax=Micromonospora sp. LOL_021 TaxID=3345417 RepID=UPI003A890E03